MKQRFGVFATLVFAVAFVPPETVSGQSDVDSGNGLALSIQIYNWAKAPHDSSERPSRGWRDFQRGWR